MTRDGLAAACERYLACFEALDVDGLLALAADDAVLRFPYATGLAPDELRGVAAIRDYLTESYTNFEQLTVSERNVVVDADAMVTVVRMIGRFALRTGGEYTNNYVHIATWNDAGELVELAEYFNPYNTARAFGALDALSR
ncbi:MAG: nuclear transport factor 2 family protein [Actinomycetota bacterium]